VEKNRK